MWCASTRLWQTHTHNWHCVCVCVWLLSADTSIRIWLPLLCTYIHTDCILFIYLFTFANAASVKIVCIGNATINGMVARVTLFTTMWTRKTFLSTMSLLVKRFWRTVAKTCSHFITQTVHNNNGSEWNAIVVAEILYMYTFLQMCLDGIEKIQLNERFCAISHWHINTHLQSHRMVWISISRRKPHSF